MADRALPVSNPIAVRNSEYGAVKLAAARDGWQPPSNARWMAFTTKEPGALATGCRKPVNQRMVALKAPSARRGIRQEPDRSTNGWRRHGDRVALLRCAIGHDANDIILNMPEALNLSSSEAKER